MHIDRDRQMMDKLVGSHMSTMHGVATELIDHPATSARVQPDIAIDNPNKISGCFSVSPAHVADLWIGSKTMRIGDKGWVFVFYEYASMAVWVIRHHLLDGLICRIGLGSNAEVSKQFRLRVVLLKGSSEAFVEARLVAFAGPDHGNVWNLIIRLGEDGSSTRDAAVVYKSAPG